MTKLARTIRLDVSDTQVFTQPAPTGVWAIPGGFAFSDWSEDDLTGKARQDFANGWLDLDTFGRATFVAVAEASEAEIAALRDRLADHFVERYGAPDRLAALPTAAEEIAFMIELCADHTPNTLLAVSRELTGAGVRESFRAIAPTDAHLDQVAVHASPD
ncbi:DUF6505 family protein [Pontivivens ytuae]|uniref:Uncharacterized protein n=1 Tax=Pontivivens ytuae TaxID=2789856 RepID=A0A7S9QCB0_9RHOB|nr:DUF6505 family protein [Pontivivens ytuae]QPH53197.1 hypothetical protein I0K15_15535 [Pontivivens ytuae]